MTETAPVICSWRNLAQLAGTALRRILVNLCVPVLLSCFINLPGLPYTNLCLYKILVYRDFGATWRLFLSLLDYCLPEKSVSGTVRLLLYPPAQLGLWWSSNCLYCLQLCGLSSAHFFILCFHSINTRQQNCCSYVFIMACLHLFCTYIRILLLYHAVNMSIVVSAIAIPSIWSSNPRSPRKHIWTVDHSVLAKVTKATITNNGKNDLSFGLWNIPSLSD